MFTLDFSPIAMISSKSFSLWTKDSFESISAWIAGNPYFIMALAFFPVLTTKDKTSVI